MTRPTALIVAIAGVALIAGCAEKPQYAHSDAEAIAMSTVQACSTKTADGRDSVYTLRFYPLIQDADGSLRLPTQYLRVPAGEDTLYMLGECDTTEAIQL